jgi:hypothetical protein
MSTRTTIATHNRRARIRRLAGTALAATALTAVTLGVTTLIAPSAQAAHSSEVGALKLAPSIPIPPPHPTRR